MWCFFNLTGQFCKLPKRVGPTRKICSKDEFLLLLIRSRLGPGEKDLTDRFKITLSLTSNIIRSWLRGTADTLGKSVFVPHQEVLNDTEPPQFNPTNNLHSIIDATELFIQTPKGHKNQCLTWSNYKHHNTMKILVAVTPNSSIIFVSKAYSGSISDKALTNRCNYLDRIDLCCQLMADKGFNIADDCASRYIELIIPPGKHGQSQMLPKAVKKTNSITKMRSLVEQVIRQLKIFKILANEVPISVILIYYILV